MQGPENITKSEDRGVQLAETVKAEFLHAWNGYKKYAWGHDSLKPLSRSHHNWYEASLLMTPVDALDTMLIMGLQDEADEALELIVNQLNLDVDIFVSTFEVSIRVLGGLLSSYQMTQDIRLLNLAQDLGNRLLPAFDSPTGMPYGEVNLKTGEARRRQSNPAEIGTLTLEFGMLTRLTGYPIYYEKAKGAALELSRRTSSIGLVGSEIDIETGEWIRLDAHIGERIDSYYEYLYKAWALFGDYDFYLAWNKGRNGIQTYLEDRVDGSLWYGRSNMWTGERISTQYGALEAFLPSLFAISGDLNRAIDLQDSGFKMWSSYGVEPEQFDYVSMKALDSHYYLRPEIFESTYYLYYLTQDKKYFQMGVTLFEDLVKNCRTRTGYAALSNVQTGEKDDAMESFFLAETLKYAYLIFAPRETLELEKVVLNTEAHPFRL